MTLFEAPWAGLCVVCGARMPLVWMTGALCPLCDEAGKRRTAALRALSDLARESS